MKHIPGAMSARRALALMLALGTTHLGWAAAAVPFAAPGVQSVSSPGGGMLRVTLALILVLAAVFATGWFVRRMRGLSGERSTGLEVLGQVPLGARERAVLIRVGELQLLLGVAPGSVRTLHVLPPGTSVAPSALKPEAMLPPTFKSLLLKSLGK